MNRKSLSGVLLLAFIIPATASANPEPTAYDTKSVALGLTGVSYLERPAALAINPALLEGIDKFAVTVLFNPFFVNQQAPVQGPGSKLKSGIGIGPLGSFFLAGRIAPRVVFGGGAYLEVAYGSDFAGVTNIDGPADQMPAGTEGAGNTTPEDLRVIFVVGEIALGPSFKVSDKVNIGVALRIPFAKQVANLFQNVGAALGSTIYSNVKNDLTGVGWPSARFGISYEPIPELTLGAMYRPYAKIPLSGTTNVKDPLNLGKGKATATWRVPHAVQFGGTLRLLDQKLWIILEERLQFHNAKRTGNEDQTVNAEVGGIQQSLVVPFGWRNVTSTKLGLQYKFSDLVEIRGGANAAISATTDKFAQYFTPPPGLNWFVSYGVGFNWDKIDLDLAGAFAWGGKTISSSVSRDSNGDPITVTINEGKGNEATFRLCSVDQVTRTGCAGKYTVLTFWASLSLTYHL